MLQILYLSTTTKWYRAFLVRQQRTAAPFCSNHCSKVTTIWDLDVHSENLDFNLHFHGCGCGKLRLISWASLLTDTYMSKTLKIKIWTMYITFMEYASLISPWGTVSDLVLKSFWVVWSLKHESWVELKISCIVFFCVWVGDYYSEARELKCYGIGAR